MPPGDVTINGGKTVTVVGEGAAPNQTFEFELAYANSSGVAQTLPAGVTVNGGTTTPLKAAVNSTGAGSYDFGFTAAGFQAGSTHYFTLKETAGGTGPNWQNSTVEYLLEVTIPATGGAGSISRYKTRSGTPLPAWSSVGWTTGAPPGGKMSFTNIYTTPGGLIIKKLVDKGGSTSQSFSFTVYDSANNPVNLTLHGITVSPPTGTGYNLAGGVVTMMSGGTVTISNLPVGTYYVTEGASNYTAKWQIEGGTGGDGVKSGNMPISSTSNPIVTFTNTPKPTQWAPEALKKTVGKNMTADQFTFELWEANISGTREGPAYLQTKKNILGGAGVMTSGITFDPITLDTAKVYYFLLSETASTEAGWIMDKTEYLYRVTVSDNNGQLTTALVPVDFSSDKDTPSAFAGWKTYAGAVKPEFENEWSRYGFEFIKTDRNDNPLGGVEFELYACKYAGTAEAGGHTHSAVADGSAGCCWELLDTQESGPTGKVSFGELDPGQYILAETKTQPGFMLPMGQWLISIDIDGEITIEARGDIAPPAFKTGDGGTYTLPNYPNFDMPLTGGLTSMLLSVTGVIIIGLVSLKLFLLYRKRRQSNTGMAG